MKSEQKLLPLLSIIFISCALMLSIMGLMGYISGLLLLGSVSKDYIPMAPSTAFSFLILGAVLLFMMRKKFNKKGILIAMTLTVVVVVFGILGFIGSLCGIDLNLERALMPEAGTLNGVPVGLMSPATGIGFFISGIAVLFALLRKIFPASFLFLKHLSGIVGFVAWSIGFVFCLAYLYGTPLLYGWGATIPMALTTALGFVLLTTSIMLNSGKEEFPVKIFCWNSTRGYLFSHLMPLSGSAVILGGLAVFHAHHSYATNPALATAFLTVAATVLTGFFSLATSRHMGDRIDRMDRELRRAIDNLRASEENLSITLNSIGDAVIATNLESRITKMNPVAEMLTGWQLSDAKGKHLLEVFNIISAETRKPVENLVEKVINTRRIIGLANHTVLIAKNGTEYHVADSASPILDGDSKITGAVLVFRDVSEEYRLAEAIRESELRFKTIFKQSPIGMALINPLNGSIIEMNRKFSEICGIHRSGMKDSWFTATHSDDMGLESSLLAQLHAREKDIFTISKRYIRPDESIAWLNTTITAIKVDGDDDFRYLCMIDDITGVKEAEQKIKQLAKFPDENPNPVMRVTGDGLLLYSNRSGHPLLSLWNVKENDLLPEPWLQRVRDVALQNKLTEFEEECYGAVFSLMFAPVREMDYVNIYGFDISKRKQAEDRLSAALSAAEAGNIAKTEFLCTMSHEIRTPLNGILGFAGILKEDLPGNVLDSRVKEYFNVIENSGNTLLEIINDVLELSNIESGQFKEFVEEISPERLIRDCLEMFKFKSREKNIQLKFIPQTLPERVTGDGRRLKQILFNLIGNAVKFTEYGHVEVFAGYSENKLLLCVNDTGIGIPSDKLDKILHPFYQADQSSTRKVGGSGLGLTIVSRMLEKLGGSFHIESVLHHGTSIKVEFPVNVYDAEEVFSPEPLSPTKKLLKGIKVLAVEDDPASLMYLDKILQDSGAEYRIVDSYEAMQQACKAGMIPDVALLDIAMPSNDGFDCLNWLLEYFPNHDIKFIAQTAHVMLDKVEGYEKAGFHDFIGKPYSNVELTNVVYRNISSGLKV